MREWRRFIGPIFLALLAPLVAEYLLGDLMITQPDRFPATALIYGGGAVLIREAARRSGGWPSFVCLALAYGLLEEGIADQSLFNPDFMHQHLLAYGYWSTLGTAAPWAINVVVLHVVWSLAVPIGMAECLFPKRRTEPWLGPVGLGVTALLFLAGVATVTAYFAVFERVHASAAQFGTCAALILALVTAAFTVARRRSGRPCQAPFPPLSLGVAGFVAGSAFVILYSSAPTVLRWPPAVTATVQAALAALILIVPMRGGPYAWRPAQAWAASTAGLLVYVWQGYGVDMALHGRSDLIGHTAVVGGLSAVQAVAGFRVMAASSRSSTDPDGDRT